MLFPKEILIYISKYIDNAESWGRYARTCKMLAKNARELKEVKQKEFNYSPIRTCREFAEVLRESISEIMQFMGGPEAFPESQFLLCIMEGVNPKNIVKWFHLNMCPYEKFINNGTISPPDSLPREYMQVWCRMDAETKDACIEKMVILFKACYYLTHTA